MNDFFRLEKNFNRGWKYANGENPGAEKIDYNDDSWVNIGLPHSFSIPYDLYDDEFYVGIGWYRKCLTIPPEWSGKKIFLEFNGVFQIAWIYINGKYVSKSRVYGFDDDFEPDGKTIAPTHKGGYAGFSVDITEYLARGTNTVAIKVSNVWSADLVPRGGDHQFSGGIYRTVKLVVTNPVHVDWYGTFVWTPALCNPCFQASENRPVINPDADTEWEKRGYNSLWEMEGTGTVNILNDYVGEEELLNNILKKTSDVEVQTEISNETENSKFIFVKHEIIDQNKNIIAEFHSEEIRIDAGSRAVVKAKSKMIENIQLWSFDHAVLYVAKSSVYADGELIDETRVVFGFRSAQFKLDGFYLNGVKTLLYGANVHQDHVGWADAVTQQGFCRDVEMVKEAGFNFIRGSHYPHAPEFADACDRFGIGFWSEGGIWGAGAYNDDDSIAKNRTDWLRSAYPRIEKYQEEFEKTCYEIVKNMIRINRNHPSVIIWSMGNEAFFSDKSVMMKAKKLIGKMRDMAHLLDPTRKTGLGGTQREDFNVLAVCDVAGGNGDGGTEQYTNFYLPHMVSEYSSFTDERPGVGELKYDCIFDKDSKTGFSLPKRTIMLENGEEVLSESAGLSLWCMYHHGSVGSLKLRRMGIVDYSRLPLRQYYLYRSILKGIAPPIESKNGIATRIELKASANIILDNKENDISTVMYNDGTRDIQLIVTLTNDSGEHVNEDKEIILEIISGNGVFPGGKTYTLIPGKTMFDGRGAVEVRSFYSGKTVIKASSSNKAIASAYITVETINNEDFDDGCEPSGFMEIKKVISDEIGPMQSYKKIDVAYNRQARADSSDVNHLPVHAIDGAEDSFWQAGVAGNQSWWVLTEGSYYIYQLKFDFGLKKYDYSIYILPPGIGDDWIKVSENKCHNDVTGAGEENLDGIYAAGIKIEFQNVPNNEYVRIYSCQAFGTTEKLNDDGV